MGLEKTEHISRGVILRTYGSGRKALQIRFIFKGIRCTETLKRVTPNKQGQKYAERLLGEIENAIERQTFNYLEYFPDSKRAKMFGYSVTRQTVGEALEEWLQDIKKSQRPVTYKTYKRHVKKLEPLFRLRKRDLAPKHVRELVRSWDGLSIKTISNSLIPLRAIVDQAIIDEELKHHAVKGVKLAKLVTRRPKTESVDPFEFDEIAKIIRTASEIDEPFQNFIQFGFFQGARKSELYGLQWPDIDWNRLTAKINRTRVDGILLEETKTAAGEREIDLTVGGYEALVRQKKYTWLHSEFVFCRPNLKPFVKYEHASDLWKQVLRALKIRYREQRQMRHTFASHKLSHGENLFYMAEQMGHENAEMLFRVYAKWIKSAKDRGEMPVEFALKRSAEGTQSKVRLLSN